jgi:lipoate-protein ligase A
MTTWKLLDTGADIGARNMAIDEELLARAQAGETLPVLRFYTWDPPAVSLGRFQKIGAAVDAGACKRRGIDIVRRITGGRAVLHHRELTYSIVARVDDPLFPSDVLGTYRVIAACLLAGLKNLGIPAEMVSRKSRHAPLVKKEASSPACFSSPSWYEIVVRHRKIIGSAQRRLPRAFLQHGSVLLDYDPGLEAEVIPGGCAGDVVTSVARELGRDVPLAEVKQAFVKGFAETLQIELAMSPLPQRTQRKSCPG